MSAADRKRFIAADEIHAQVDWLRILPRLGIAETFLNGKHGPCPAGHGKDCFRFDNKYGRGDYICSKSDPIHGDGFELVMHVQGCDFSTARKMILQAAGIDADTVPPQSTLRAESHTQHQALSPYGRTLFRETVRMGGVGAQYLEARNCRLPPKDSHLRFHPMLKHPSGYVGPALVALVTDAVTNEPMSLHRTWIRPDGTKAPVDPPRLLLKGHRKGGGVIRLWPDEAVALGLAVGEGIESCLAFAHVHTPIWSAIDAGNLAALPVLAGLESLIIVSDHDAAGMKSARDCAHRWAPHVAVVTVTPNAPGADLADVVAA